MLLVAVLLSSCSDRPEKPAPPEPVQTLFDAAYAGDAALARTLIRQGSNINAVNDEGLTPLHVASAGGHKDVVRVFLAMEADPSIRDQGGFTCLHAAARNGHLDVVKLLVEFGASVEAESNEGLTPLDVAELKQETAVSEYLRSLTAPPIEEVPEPVVEVELKEEEEGDDILLSGESFRVWTSASGAEVTAEFIECVGEVVTLRRNDGEYLRIRLNQLSPSDQVAVRKHDKDLPDLYRRPTKKRTPSSKPRASIAERIGKEQGWEVITGCRLLRRRGNDGDSFHVQADGRERIFRLYYVDAAETSDKYPDRVEAQAGYFDLDEKETVKVGREAKKFTAGVLSKGTFTVVTRWEDARGASSLPRHYAFVVTDYGDLDELLVAEGLVRIYGMDIDSATGSRKRSELYKLEREARREKVGAWGIGTAVTAEPGN
jgi:ankyrin repeat protein/endonuclease YncB( thermonuclease family)